MNKIIKTGLIVGGLALLLKMCNVPNDYITVKSDNETYKSIVLNKNTTANWTKEDSASTFGVSVDGKLVKITPDNLYSENGRGGAWRKINMGFYRASRAPVYAQNRFGIAIGDTLYPLEYLLNQK